MTPMPVETFNWKETENLCRDYIKALTDRKSHHTRLKQYIFEAAVEAVYGNEIWEWINEMEEKI